jgi:hypothetical protein
MMEGVKRLLGEVTAASAAALMISAGCSANTDRSQRPTQGESSKAAATPVLTKPNMSDELLFVARSPEATLELNEDGVGTLTMTSTPTMTWFSDRPEHDAGTTATTDALAAFGWEKDGDDLGAVAPNAVLTGNELADAVVIELRTVERAGDALSFTVKAINDVPEDERTVDVSHADLFIDSVGEAEGQVIGTDHNGIGVNAAGAYDFAIDFLLMADGTKAANIRFRAVYKKPFIPGMIPNPNNAVIVFSPTSYTVALTEAEPRQAVKPPFPWNAVYIGTARLNPDGSVTITAIAEARRLSYTARP